MEENPPIARIAALIGDPARANMLLTLMHGGARTLSELAIGAGVGLSTASAHAAQLLQGGLIRARKSGRHKYMELASAEVAALIEHLMAVQAGLLDSGAAKARHPGPKDPALRHARVCYDHLAGDMGIALHDHLITAGHLVAAPTGLMLTAQGHEFARDFGVAPGVLAPARAPLCRECLDWSARRSHLGGRLGRALLTVIETKGWASRHPDTRIIRFTPKGQHAFLATFAAGAGRDNLTGTLP